ncbi:MAG: GerMN domain-containing protein [Schwartzia sp.]|nr:GerMN domain-containing protein [Schwartzia sp. (in: firmicutes)]
MNNRGKAALAAAMTAVLLMAAGCEEAGKSGQQSAPPAASSSSQVKPGNPKLTPPAVAKQEEVKLYFPNDAGDGLGSVKVSVPAEDKYTAAAKALVAGTKEPGLTNIFPMGVKVLGVKVEGDLATVNFSKELTHKFVGGSTGEQMLVSALVNTMTEFPEIKRVLITVEGERIETIAGHLDTSEPFTRPTGLVQ